MPVHYRYSGDKEAGIAIKRTVDRELDKHLDNTRLGNLEQNRSVTTFVNGTVIECKSIFNNHLVNVFVPIKGKKGKEEKTEEYEIVSIVPIMELVSADLEKGYFQLWYNLEKDIAGRFFDDKIQSYNEDWGYVPINMTEISGNAKEYKLKELDLISTYGYYLTTTTTTIASGADNPWLGDVNSTTLYQTYLNTGHENVLILEATRDRVSYNYYPVVIVGLIPMTNYPMNRAAIVTDNEKYAEGSTYIYLLVQENWEVTDGNRTPPNYIWWAEKIFTLHYGNSQEGHQSFEIGRMPAIWGNGVMQPDAFNSEYYVLSHPRIYDCGGIPLYTYSIYDSINNTYRYEFIFNGVRHQSVEFPVTVETYPTSLHYDVGDYHDFHNSTIEYNCRGRGYLRVALETIKGQKE